MQLTKKAGNWTPRLERMVQSRGLCPFEKQVLLTLIGFVIQPNKVSAIIIIFMMMEYMYRYMYMYMYDGCDGAVHMLVYIVSALNFFPPDQSI